MPTDFPQPAPSPGAMKALHEVEFPIGSSNGKDIYRTGALVSLDKTNHRALIECGGKLYNVPMGNVRNLHKVLDDRETQADVAELLRVLKLLVADAKAKGVEPVLIGMAEDAIFKAEGRK